MLDVSVTMSRCLLRECLKSDCGDVLVCREEKVENDEDRFSTSSAPSFPAQYYIDHANTYFDSLESRFHWRSPRYSLDVVRWEWPPWLLLTSMGRSNITAIDSFLRLYPCLVVNREFRFYSSQPFVRSLVTVLYGDEVLRRSQPLRIYEEFTFNDMGEITFIEAWWARKSLELPAFCDGWPVDGSFNRLSTKLPGLGNVEGSIRMNSPAMHSMASRHPDVAEFCKRAKKFYSYIGHELLADMIKSRETLFGVRLRRRTDSFLFKRSHRPNGQRNGLSYLRL